jgi:acyl-CoA hydrolase
MVAVDEAGRPTEIPPLRCDSPDELRREQAAQVRRRNRLAEREELVRRDHEAQGAAS